VEAKIIKGKGACILVSSMIALTGCGSDNNSEQPLNSQDNQTTETRTYPHWVPKLTEYYDSEGNLTSCIRAELDSDGFILTASTSYPSTDPDQPVQCNDDDQHIIDAEFIFNNERTVFSTMTQSNFSPSVACQQVMMSTKNMPNRIETYVSGTQNFSCSIQDGTLYSIQLFTLEDDLYEKLVVLYNNPGQDNEWETDDDVIQARFVSTWSTDRLLQKTTTYFGPGNDGIWGTTDDLVSGAFEMTFKEDMIPDFSISSSPGNDGILGTQDDLITGYTVFTYENGLIKNHTTYNSPGLDGIWDTLEDNGKQHTVFY